LYVVMPQAVMPLAPAEKMKLYRERLKQNPNRRKEYLEKERERWKQRRESGKEKAIHELQREPSAEKEKPGEKHRDVFDCAGENKLLKIITPKTKTKHMLCKQRVQSMLKGLLFHNALVAAVKGKAESMKSCKDKQLLSKIFASKIMKKYRVTSHMTPLGITPKLDILAAT